MNPGAESEAFAFLWIIVAFLCLIGGTYIMVMLAEFTARMLEQRSERG